MTVNRDERIDPRVTHCTAWRWWLYSPSASLSSSETSSRTRRSWYEAQRNQHLLRTLQRGGFCFCFVCFFTVRDIINTRERRLLWFQGHRTKLKKMRETYLQRGGRIVLECGSDCNLSTSAYTCRSCRRTVQVTRHTLNRVTTMKVSLTWNSWLSGRRSALRQHAAAAPRQWQGCYSFAACSEDKKRPPPPRTTSPWTAGGKEKKIVELRCVAAAPETVREQERGEAADWWN